MNKTLVIIPIYFLFIISCKTNIRNDKASIRNNEVVKTTINNGINYKLLKVIDSIPYSVTKENFISISFGIDTLRNPIIRVGNCLLMPIPPMPPKRLKKVLISEGDDFIGYKEYKNKTLVFFKGYSNDKYHNFLIRDSLRFDEIPFKKFNVYENRSKRLHEGIERVYRIIGNDSLLLIKNTNYNNQQ